MSTGSELKCSACVVVRLAVFGKAVLRYETDARAWR